MGEERKWRQKSQRICSRCDLGFFGWLGWVLWGSWFGFFFFFWRGLCLLGGFLFVLLFLWFVFPIDTTQPQEPTSIIKRDTEFSWQHSSVSEEMLWGCCRLPRHILLWGLINVRDRSQAMWLMKASSSSFFFHPPKFSSVGRSIVLLECQIVALLHLPMSPGREKGVAFHRTRSPQHLIL